MASRPALDSNFHKPISAYIKASSGSINGERETSEKKEHVVVQSQNNFFKQLPTNLLPIVFQMVGHTTDIFPVCKEWNGQKDEIAHLSITQIQESAQNKPSFLNRILTEIQKDKELTLSEIVKKVRQTAVTLLEKGQHVLPKETRIDVEKLRTKSLDQLEALSMPISEARAQNLIMCFKSVIEYSSLYPQFRQEAFLLLQQCQLFTPREIASQIRKWMREHPERLDQVVTPDTAAEGEPLLPELFVGGQLDFAPPEMLLFKHLNRGLFYGIVRGAAAKGGIEFFEELIKRDPRWHTFSPLGLGGILERAAACGQLEIIDLFIKSDRWGAISADGVSLALAFAVKNGHVKAIEKLMPHVQWNKICLANERALLVVSKGSRKIARKLITHPKLAMFGISILGILGIGCWVLSQPSSQE
jgi:hypothetical protein